MHSRKPEWLKVRPPGGVKYSAIRSLMNDLRLHTVCEGARCPNSAECWGNGTATIMILGDICTRGCRFCSVESGNPQGRLDPDEPSRVSEAVSSLNLDYVVLTSVDRDDLPDGGADHYASTLRAIKEKNPRITVEALIPDFGGNRSALNKVIDAGPDVIAHNIETVERLTGKVRDKRSKYWLSIDVLRTAKEIDSDLTCKSSMMVGLGETDEEIARTFSDVRAAGVVVITIGQYLRPSHWHLPVEEYISPEKFEEYRRVAESFGFLYVASGPLVRSSYRAGEYFMAALAKSNSRKVADGG